jgi:response regulator RpfG family c-di-GMP phosphodiesterase
MSESSKSGKPARARKPFIYLVDDEPLLLDLAEASLQEHYRTRKFLDPEEAWKAFGKEAPKPALLISDYAMGKMNGVELIARCKNMFPELKTMLLSGTAGAEIVLNAPVKVDRFLGKPYPPATLLETVKEMLG